MSVLTDRQREILLFIVDEIAAKGWAPTFREIMTRFQFRSTNAVVEHLRALEKKGYLVRAGGSSRALRPVLKAVELSRAPRAET